MPDAQPDTRDSGGLRLGCGSEPALEPAAAIPETEPPAAPAAAETLPDVIVAERGGFIPEGVEYDMMNGCLLTGSLTEGSVLAWSTPPLWNTERSAFSCRRRVRTDCSEADPSAANNPRSHS